MVFQLSTTEEAFAVLDVVFSAIKESSFYLFYRHTALTKTKLPEAVRCSTHSVSSSILSLASILSQGRYCDC